MRTETVVLATLCKSKIACSRYVHTLKKEDFEIDDNQKIYEGLVKLVKKGGHQTSIIRNIIKETDWDYLEFISYSSEQDIDKWYIAFKHEVGQKSISETTFEILTGWKNGHGDVHDFAKVVQQYQELGEFSLVANDPSMKSAIEDLKEMMKEALTYDKNYFGMKCFNDSIRTFKKGRMYIIGARPAVGKTTLGIQLVDHRAKQGEAVVFVTGEMGKGEIVALLINQRTGIDYGRIVDNDLSNDESLIVGNVIRDLEDHKFFIIDETDLDVVIQRLYALKEKHNIVGVCVDYIQLMSLSGYRDKTQEISEISKRLKKLTQKNKLDVWMVGIAQLKRSGKKMPVKEMLKDSGQLEQDADCIILLHSDYEAHGQDERFSKEEISMIIAKYRQVNFRKRPYWILERTATNKFGDVGRKEDIEVDAFENIGDPDLPF